MRRSSETLSCDVLVFSEISDFHTERVVKYLPPDCSVLILNLDKYGDDFTISSSESGISCVCRHHQAGLVEYDLSRVRALWWRRPFGLNRSQRWVTATAATHPVLGFLYGAISRIGSAALQVNNLNSQFAADRKLWQLHVAKASGFCIPDTLIATNRNEIVEFARAAGQVVVKAHSSISELNGTMFFEDFDNSMINDTGEPLIVQRYVRAALEHRIIYCCGFVAGGTFDLSGIAQTADVRTVPNLLPYRAKIPPSLELCVRAYCKAMNLNFAAFDVREDSGAFTFLEANTCGEWLHVDGCNDYRITETLISRLSTPPL